MELDKMLATGIIEPVEESEWVNLMVVQEKKTKGEIIIYVDLRKQNDSLVAQLEEAKQRKNDAERKQVTLERVLEEACQILPDFDIPHPLLALM